MQILVAGEINLTPNSKGSNVIRADSFKNSFSSFAKFICNLCANYRKLEANVMLCRLFNFKYTMPSIDINTPTGYIHRRTPTNYMLLNILHYKTHTLRME